MTAAAMPTASQKMISRAITIPAEWLAAMLIGLFAFDNLLLLLFLGMSPIVVLLLAIAITAGFYWLISRPAKKAGLIPLKVIGCAILISLTIFLLGGEGRFFFANADWQIRDAILNDMSSLPWPFAYALDGKAAILRAPLGMYLLPSMAGKSGLHEIALLLSNALRFAIVLALGWQLFDSRTTRIIALIIFLAFSGWDIVGTWFYSLNGIPVSWDHLETWNFGFQYSSHITQAFWVPQHALAGWTAALMFLLWRKGLAPIGWFAATVPLVAIWSPLAIMGTVPFVLLAGINVLIRRDFNGRDVGLALLALVVALPALFYMQMDATKLGSEIRHAPMAIYLLLFAFEVAPFILLPLLDPSNTKMERLTLWIIFLCLLFMPFWKIGVNSDFQMRASIMPLALLAVAFAEWTIGMMNQRPLPRGALAFAAVALTIGAITPALELRRTLVNGPSPVTRCSLVGVWTKQAGLIAPYATYLADTGSLPGSLKTIPAIAGLRDPDRCWDRKWVVAEAPE
jgi:hypothetical protein